MTHKHSIYDTDPHFSINPITRTIINQSTSKTSLIQGDHNSERFTFEIPRHIEEHDMSLCDKVEVHYINLGYNATDKSEDVYIVPDLQISPDDENVVIFSWLISGNATKYAGSLSFLVGFKCLTGEVIDYAWHTGIFSNINVGEGINNGEAVIADNSDVLETWKAEVLSNVLSAAAAANTAAERSEKAATDAESFANSAKDDADRAEAAVTEKKDAALAEIEAKGEKVLSSLPEDYVNLVVQTTGDSEDKVMSQKAVTEALNAGVVKVPAGNLFDANTMTIIGSMYNRKADNTVQVLTNSYTTQYVGLAIPLDDTQKKITLSYKYNWQGYFYNWFMVDGNGNIISYTASNTNPGAITLDIPEGAKMLKTSFLYSQTDMSTAFKELQFMGNYGDTALPWEEFSVAYTIDGKTLATENFVEEKLAEISIPSEPSDPAEVTDILTLPRKFNLIVGDTFEMFYKGISNVLDSNIYDYEISFSDGISRGKGWKRNYEWTPTADDVGTKTMTITVRDNTGKAIDSASVDLIVADTPTSPTLGKVVCCVGDSLTQDGWWCSELRRRLIASDGTPTGYGLTNINFIGTKENADGCRFEGAGGWTFDNYSKQSLTSSIMNIYGTFDKTDDDQHSVYADSNGAKWKLETIGTSTIKIIRVSSSGTLPASGTLTWVSGGVNTGNIVYTSSEKATGNPFWSEEKEANDFVAYAARMGVSAIDHMIILLGWNSVHETETSYKTKVRNFIDGVRADFPNCKITLLGVQVPSRDGFANNYGISWKYYEKLQHVWNLNKWYQDIADEYDDIEFVNIAGQFDTEYNCITMTKKPNARSSTNITVQSNGVHPAIPGYYQIADAVLRNFVTHLN